MKNIVTAVIDETDMSVIETIAKKYKMSVVEFGRFLGKSSNAKGVRFHVRFTVDEMEIVNNKASYMGTSRSKLCAHAWKDFLDSGAYKKFNVRDVKGKDDESGRTERICVIFQEPEEFEKLQEIAASYSIPFSALLRYCVLNYK